MKKGSFSLEETAAALEEITSNIRNNTEILQNVTTQMVQQKQ